MAGARERRRGEAQTAKNRGEAGWIGILGRRQVTPIWADDNVWRHINVGGVREGGGCPPHPEGYKEAGREGGAGQVKKYVTISDTA